MSTEGSRTGRMGMAAATAAAFIVAGSMIAIAAFAPRNQVQPTHAAAQKPAREDKPAKPKSAKAERKRKEAVPPILLESPFEVSAHWLIDELEMGEPVERQLAAAASDQARVDSILAEFFSKQPDVRGFERVPKNAAATIKQYHEGYFELGRNDPVEFSLPLDWSREDQGSNFIAELHSLRLLTNFANEFSTTGDRQYLEVVESVLMDWMRKNPYPDGQHERAWHEGAVAKRVLVLISIFDVYKRTAPPRAIPLAAMLKLIYQHAEYLMRDQTYRPNGNHGIRQDLALLIASLALKEFTRAGDWQQTGIDRLRHRQVETSFSSEGIWREHSPGYHYYVMELFHDFLGVMEQNGLSERADFLRGLHEQSQNYYAHMLTPLGTFPPVGDTNEYKPAMHRMTSPAAQYTASMGQSGSPSEELDGYFPDAGEAMLRSDWGTPGRPAGEAFYVHIQAANHDGFGHRHADELSFIMHGLGRWWILEAGKYAYDRDDYRRHVITPQAHNCYTFNGQGLDWNDRQDASRFVKLEPACVSTDELAAVRGVTTRFEQDGAKVTRTFVFLRKHDTLVLLDQLTAPTSGHWESFVHLPPDAEAITSSDRVEVRVPTHPSHRLHIVTEADKTPVMTIFKGETDPMRGWYSPEFREIVPTPVVVYGRTGRELVIATVMHVCGDAAPAPANVRSSATNAGHTITWDAGSRHPTLAISAKGPLSVSFEQ